MQKKLSNTNFALISSTNGGGGSMASKNICTLNVKKCKITPKKVICTPRQSCFFQMLLLATVDLYFIGFNTRIHISYWFVAVVSNIDNMFKSFLSKLTMIGVNHLIVFEMNWLPFSRQFSTRRQICSPASFLHRRSRARPSLLRRTLL